MVQAGEPVDKVLAELVPLLEKGDIVIDGGNSLFRDTERRWKDVTARGWSTSAPALAAARKAPASARASCPAARRRRPTTSSRSWQAIAAKTEDAARASPTSAPIGRPLRQDGPQRHRVRRHAAHLRSLRPAAPRAGLSTRQLADVFGTWNKGELKSFLIEITAKIVNHPDDLGTGQPLIDVIEDARGRRAPVNGRRRPRSICISRFLPSLRRWTPG